MIAPRDGECGDRHDCHGLLNVCKLLLAGTLMLARLVAKMMPILVIVYPPWGNWLFGTAPLAVEVWWFAAPFALLLWAAEEMRKLLARLSASLKQA